MATERRRMPYGRTDAGEAPAWDGRAIRSLRRHMGLSQDELAGELGTRQQTVSEWETGRYRPRGASSRLLSIVAERAGFEYGKTESGEEKQARGTGVEESGEEP